MRNVALVDVLMRLVLPWMLTCVDSCTGGSDILSMERHVLRWVPCGGAGVSVTCNNPGRRLVLYSLNYNVTCTPGTTCTADTCREDQISDTNRQAPRCNLNKSCSIPPYQCPPCYLLQAILMYACVPEDRLFAMCSSLQGVRDVTWGILHSDMFPLHITTHSCTLVLRVRPSWTAVVRPLYLELPYPARIDVCSERGNSFQCLPPGDETHLGDVTIHVTNAPVADSTRFVLEFEIYSGAKDTTTVGLSSTTTQTGSERPTASSTGNGSAKGARNVSTRAMVVPTTDATRTAKMGSSTVGLTDQSINDDEKALVSGDEDSSLTTQDYVIIFVGVCLGVVIISSVTICIVVYRRTRDTALHRVVVVLVRNPTKRLSRLSRLSSLFRTGSHTDQHQNRYSNPPEDLPSSSTSRPPVTSHALVVEGSAQTVLTRLKQLGVPQNLPESWSSDSGRYEHPADAVPTSQRLPLRRKRRLDPTEVVIEASADVEQTTSGYSRSSKNNPAASTSKLPAQRVSSDDPIYEIVAKPALPPRRRSIVDVDLTSSALDDVEMPSAALDDVEVAASALEECGPAATTSQNKEDDFTGEGLTIVDNDSYADVDY